MATTAYKVLGQSNPSATSNSDVYTVPAATEAIISTGVICNRGASATTFRIAVRVNGAGIANSQYIYYDVSIGANDTFAFTFGVTLDAGDVVTVYAGNGNLTFSFFGSEIS